MSPRSLCFLIHDHAEALNCIEKAYTINLSLLIIGTTVKKPMSVDYIRLISIKIALFI